MRNIGAIGVLVILVIGGLALAGWIQDIVHFVRCDFVAPYKAEVIYGIGLVPCIGAIVGWLNIGH